MASIAGTDRPGRRARLQRRQGRHHRLHQVGGASEVAHLGIQVNAIAPGFVDTPLLDALSPDDEACSSIAQTPLGRLGTVDDIAAAALYLASPAGGLRHRAGAEPERRVTTI